MAGGIVRVSLNGRTYDLRITRDEPRTDAGGDPPACLDKAGTVQYGLNWAASDLHRPVPAVEISLLTTYGAPLTVGDPQRGCYPARHIRIPSLTKNSQYILPLAAHAGTSVPNRLRIIVNDQPVTLPLSPICDDNPAADASRPPCAEDPLIWDAAAPYSVRLAT